MKTKLNDVVTALFLVIVALAALNTSTQAQEAANVIGYAKDSAGNIVHSGESGNCVRTGNWGPENQTVEGCDGVVLAITAPGVSMFAFDSAELTPAGRAVIDKHRDKLKPKLAAGYTGMVVGYTDSSGDPSYNVMLSVQRAEAVQNYLFGSDVKPGKINVIGRGASHPAASNDTRKGRAINRRVEVILLDEKSAAK